MTERKINADLGAIFRSVRQAWREEDDRPVATPKWRLLIIGVSLLCSATAAAPAENWKPVQGSALRSLFANKEYGDGVHYAYRFRPDGTFSGTEMGKVVRGTWRVTDREACWKWIRPPGAEECYRVQKDGNQVRLLKDGAEAWYGSLTP